MCCSYSYEHLGPQNIESTDLLKAGGCLTEVTSNTGLTDSIVDVGICILF